MNSSNNPIQLGLRENLNQFLLLVLVNAFVGSMVGLERSILPLLAEQEFHLVARSAILSFIAVFGLSKAMTNYLAGHFSDRYGRKQILIAGWAIAIPVPFLLMWAPSWNWILFSNILLGISQGLTWSTTVIMKIDLVGPKQRGLAMGLNEFAGYFAVALSAWATGWCAVHYGLRPQPFYLGVVYVLCGIALSIFAIKETRHHVSHEVSNHSEKNVGNIKSSREIFFHTSFRDRNLSSISQVGLVNNLNDGMAWGLFPLFFAAAGLDLSQIAVLVAIYPAVWGSTQIVSGGLSDRIGRKHLIVMGMTAQALGIAITASGHQFSTFAIGAILLGLGTAMVYPTLLAAIGDVAHPQWRASAIGVYRLWRDMGYAVGALLAGVVADMFGLSAALWLVAALTLISGCSAAVRMKETLQSKQQSALNEAH